MSEPRSDYQPPRLAIFATAEWDRPAAAPTTRSEAPASTASRMARSRRSVHLRARSAAAATSVRSVIEGFLRLSQRAAPFGDQSNGVAAGVRLLATPDVPLAGGAPLKESPVVSEPPVVPALRHALTVNQVHGAVNQVDDICVECGDDLAAYGSIFCSDCRDERAAEPRYEKVDGWRITLHELGPHRQDVSCDEDPVCGYVYRLREGAEFGSSGGSDV